MVNEFVGVNQRVNEYNHKIVNGHKVFEHRAIWEEKFGEIPKGKMVHHINGDKKDNRIENLKLVDIKEHGKLHHLPNRKRIKYKSGAIKVVKIST